MPFELNNNEKQSLLQDRLKGFAVDAYGHQLNLQVAIEIGDAESQVIAEEAIALIETQTAIYETELQTLVVEDETELQTLVVEDETELQTLVVEDET